jgi:hypothetical protein
MHVLVERLGEWLYPVYLPYGAMPPGELCEWILGMAGETVNGSKDPVRNLLDYARWLRRTGRFLAVLIDDADSLPLNTARMVGAWIRQTKGDIGPMLAGCDGARMEQVLAALGPEVRRVRLSEAMNAHETRLYVEYQLERVDAAAGLRERFDSATIDWIFDLSGGVPRLVGELALRVIDPHLGDFEAEWSAEALVGQGEGAPPRAELPQR